MLRKVSKGKPRGAGDVYRKFPAHQAEDAAPKLTHSYGVFIPKAIMKHSDVATAWIFVLSTGFLSKFTNSSPGLNCGNFQATLNVYFSYVSYQHFHNLCHTYTAVEEISVCQATDYFFETGFV